MVRNIAPYRSNPRSSGGRMDNSFAHAVNRQFVKRSKMLANLLEIGGMSTLSGIVRCQPADIDIVGIAQSGHIRIAGPIAYFIGPVCRVCNSLHTRIYSPTKILLLCCEEMFPSKARSVATLPGQSWTFDPRVQNEFCTPYQPFLIPWENEWA